MYHLVYLTTNKINGKIYIGVHSTHDLHDGYIGSGTVLKSAFEKYGKHNFSRVVLHYCLTREHAYKWESVIVDDSFVARPDTYNIAVGGKGGMRGVMHSTKTKNQISLSKLGHVQSEQTKTKISIAKLGTVMSVESKQKISQFQTGRLKTVETKSRMSAHQRSEDHCMKISQSRSIPLRVFIFDLDGNTLGEETFPRISDFTSKYRISTTKFYSMKSKNDMTFTKGNVVLKADYVTP
jgi:group I intron endonuclease